MVPQELGELFRGKLLSTTVEQHQDVSCFATQRQQGGLVFQRQSFRIGIARQPLQVLVSQRLDCGFLGLANPRDSDVHPSDLTTEDRANTAKFFTPEILQPQRTPLDFAQARLRYTKETIIALPKPASRRRQTLCCRHPHIAGSPLSPRGPLRPSFRAEPVAAREEMGSRQPAPAAKLPRLYRATSRAEFSSPPQRG